MLRAIDLLNKTVSTICQPGAPSAYGELIRDYHIGMPQSLLVLPDNGKVKIGLHHSIGSLKINGELRYMYLMSMPADVKQYIASLVLCSV